MRSIQNKNNMDKNKVKHLLEVNDLHTSFNIPSGEVRSVNGVSFNLDKGRVLGIVGESGSGKSVTAYSIMQILQNPGRIVSGSIRFNGQELVGLSAHELEKIRGNKISIIFQDPMSSLNPVYTIGNQIIEAIKLHPVERLIRQLDYEVSTAHKALLKAKFIYEKRPNIQENKRKYNEAKEQYRLAKYHRNNYEHDRALEMLKLVGINEPEKRLKQYPFEFSGGMLQRIMIAMSLVCEPDLLIADEPTTALDVTIQAQILELLKDLQKKMGMGIIIITHDLGVVAQICDELDIMYAGRIVERGTVDEIFYHPRHEYTKGLMKSIPQADDSQNKLIPIEGNPVDVFCLPKGCSFAPRCASCMKICLEKFPLRVAVNKYHETSCFKYIIEAYKRGKITKQRLKQIVKNSMVGNEAFKAISEMDVFNAFNQAAIASKKYNKNKNNPNLTKEEKAKLNDDVKISNSNYRRVKNDFKIYNKYRKTSRKELPSLERGDMAHHIKEVKKRVKYVDDLFANKLHLYEYLENLKISSYPVDYKLHRENVAIAKQEYEMYKTFLIGIDPNDKLLKTQILCEIHEKKHEYDDISDKYLRNRRIIRKLLKVRKKLIRVNALRVIKVMRTNAHNAYRDFKDHHLMFTSNTELKNYLNGFIYAHWDFDQTITKNQLNDLYNDWQAKQQQIYDLRDKNKKADANALIDAKNIAMYKYWFSYYDYQITKAYKVIKFNFENAIRFLDKNNHKRVDSMKEGATKYE